MNDQTEWYDSKWLRAFHSARDTIAKIAPGKLQAFLDAIEPLRTRPDFEVKEIPQLLDAERLSEIKDIIKRIPVSSMSMYEIRRFGRMIVHDVPEFTEMQRGLVDRVSELAGEAVEPCYNFLCLYSRLGVCELHLDAPSAKWTLDICIDQSDAWPIHFSQIVPWPEYKDFSDRQSKEAIKTSPDLTFRSKILQPGSAILFSGSSQWHYRDPLPASDRKAFCDLLFFHYIPRGTARVVVPSQWADLFGVPQLAGITSA